MRIASTLVSLIITQTLADDTDTSAKYQQCKHLCETFERTNLKSNACQAALHVSPRPETHRACEKGVIIGYTHGCLPSCLGKPLEGTSYEPGNSFMACMKYRKKPKPLMWCRTGYDKMYATVKEEIEREVQSGRYFKGDDADTSNVDGDVPSI
jgi:hypothetical protein